MTLWKKDDCLIKAESKKSKIMLTIDLCAMLVETGKILVIQANLPYDGVFVAFIFSHVADNSYTTS